MSGTNLLEVRNLKTIFQTEDGPINAVNGISYALKYHESVGVVGESGSGKSVSHLSMLRLIPNPPGKIVGGEVFFENTDLLKLSKEEIRSIRGRDVSFIFQDPMTSLNPFLKIETQMIEGLMLHRKLSRKEAYERAVELFKRVGISEPQKRLAGYPHQMSGGMRQRVMIAMALMTKPKLLIADEPTTALDVTIQAQILELINTLRKEEGMSLILITHNLGVVAGMTDRIIVMYAGYIVEENTTSELFHRPRHPYTVGLIRSIPKIHEKREGRFYSIPGSPPSLLKLPDVCPFYPRCERRQDICKQKMPPLVSEGSGRYACYFPY
ncbi:ABC transporter ATP-binding protein [Thermospira aquatica]|uniref:ABC transporter ATP-binding protein n=1 Tax=Thermospira aquatica TaxID=2828656 RepID=A0AAX3BA05_9SPIR|nr:ABC transporter ATP-binding protein [Thermospira aquatica]URA09082.1 ABC transporter ATP-binding protein [Thermospira aquatica]